MISFVGGGGLSLLDGSLREFTKVSPVDSGGLIRDHAAVRDVSVPLDADVLIRQNVLFLPYPIDQELSGGLSQVLPEVPGALLGQPVSEEIAGACLEELDILIEGLRRSIQTSADVLSAGFNGAFPTLQSNPDVGDLRRFHFAIDLAKLAVMQEVIMRAEASLLQAYWVDGFSCEDVVENAALDTRVLILRTKLKNARQELIRYGRSNPNHRVSASASEFEFDARHFSYPINAQLEFLDGIVEDTLIKCERLRDPNDSFRAHFEANTPASRTCSPIGWRQGVMRSPPTPSSPVNPSAHAPARPTGRVTRTT